MPWRACWPASNDEIPGLSPLTDPILDILRPLALALAQGFMVGVERGWRQRDEAPGARAAGIRTFALAGLYGGLAGLMGKVAGPIALSTLLLAFAGAFVIYQLRESVADKDFSATSAVAGLVTALLGALAFFLPPTVIAAVAVTHVTLLAFREPLHVLVQRLTWQEVRSAVLLLAMAFVVAPLLPDQAIDPWGAVVPRQLWWMTVIIGAASFAGYVALRALPSAAGLMLSALAGSLVSSTAVTLDLARRVAAGGAPLRVAAGAAIAANAVMTARVAVVAGIFAPATLQSAWLPLAAGGLASAAIAAGVGLLRKGPEDGAPPELGNPLDLRTVARFGLILAVLTASGRLIAAFWGAAAFLPFAAAAGFADVDAAVLAITQAKDIPPDVAGVAIMLASVAAVTLKSILAFAAGGVRFGRPYLLGSLAAVVAGAAVWGGARLLGWG